MVANYDITINPQNLHARLAIIQLNISDQKQINKTRLSMSFYDEIFKYSHAVNFSIYFKN